MKDRPNTTRPPLAETDSKTQAVRQYKDMQGLHCQGDASGVAAGRLWAAQAEHAWVSVDFLMLGTWMLCANGWSLRGRYHGWDTWMLCANGWSLRGRYHSHGCSAQTDGVCEDAVMLGTWMLCANGWSLRGQYHGWDKLRANGWSLQGRCHAWDMDALRKRMESARTLSWPRMLCANGWSLRGRCHGWDMDALDGVCEDAVMLGTWMLCAN